MPFIMLNLFRLGVTMLAPQETVVLDFSISLRDLAPRLASAGASATVFDIWAQSNGHAAVAVAPGGTVAYEIIGLLGDDNNEGLALFGLDLDFDGGPLSQADTPTGLPIGDCDNPMIHFTLPWGITNPAGYGGTVSGGDLIQVGGGQNTINNTKDNAPFPIGPVLPGVAQPSGCGPTTLVTGSFTAPLVEGTFLFRIENLFGNVIREGETGVPFWRTESFVPGSIENLTVLVSASACGSCRLYGDIAAGYCLVDVDDVLAALDGFVDPIAVPEADIEPCGGDGDVDVDDILGGLDAFSGGNVCPHPCPPGACIADFDGDPGTADECRDESSAPGGMSFSDCYGASGLYGGDHSLCDHEAP